MGLNNLKKATSRHDYRLESAGVHLSKVKVSSLSVSHSVNRISTAQIIIVDGDVAKGKFPQTEIAEISPGRS